MWRSARTRDEAAQEVQRARREEAERALDRRLAAEADLAARRRRAKQLREKWDHPPDGPGVTRATTASINQVRPRPPASGKYAALAPYLAAQQWPTVRMSFVAVEAIIGAGLPASARSYRAWWSNETAPGRSQSDAWQAAGWRVQAVNLTAEHVTFTRA
jgi:hypothetical protein